MTFRSNPADAPGAYRVHLSASPATAPLAAPLSRRRFLARAAASAAGLAGASLAAACGNRVVPAPSRTSAPEESIAIEPGPEPGPDRVRRENARAGTDRWQLPLSGRGAAEGFFSRVSAKAGDELVLRMRASTPTASVFVYRLGWYGGAGARLVGRWNGVRVTDQPPPVIDTATGEIACRWDPTLRFTVPGDWVSGMYVAVLRPGAGEPQWASFLVREPQAEAPILFVSGLATEQAYNGWGGKSLYGDNSSGANTVAGSPRAVKVSFDRPYERTRGAGEMLRWELPFVRWQEAQGYDVGYCADVDLEDAAVISDRRLIVFCGHPEYWSVAMRGTIERAIAAGTNVAFLTANEMYWRVRLEPGVGGNARTLVCYRDAAIDPVAATDPAQASVAWGEPPAARPEGLVVGLSYGHVAKRLADLVVADASHWAFGGTGLRSGEGLARLVGTEYDRYDADPAHRPAGVQVLFSSPVEPRADAIAPVPLPAVDRQSGAVYLAPSGATVFSAGTMIWGWGLDGWGDHTYQGDSTPVDPRLARITANLLDRLGR